MLKYNIAALALLIHCIEFAFRKKNNCHLAFSLVTEKESHQTLDFIAPDDKTFNLWTDGVNALLGK